MAESEKRANPLLGHKDPIAEARRILADLRDGWATNERAPFPAPLGYVAHWAQGWVRICFLDQPSAFERSVRNRRLIKYFVEFEQHLLHAQGAQGRLPIGAGPACPNRVWDDPAFPSRFAMLMQYWAETILPRHVADNIPDRDVERCRRRLVTSWHRPFGGVSPIRWLVCLDGPPGTN